MAACESAGGRPTIVGGLNGFIAVAAFGVLEIEVREMWRTCSRLPRNASLRGLLFPKQRSSFFAVVHKTKLSRSMLQTKI